MKRPAWSANGSRRCAATAIPWREIAILVRAGFQTRAFEERMILIGLPYRVIGGLRFYERQEIRDAVAYMRAPVQPADDLAFERIVNVPRRGVGEAALRTMHEVARADAIPLADAAAKLIENGGLRGKVKERSGELLVGLPGGGGRRSKRDTSSPSPRCWTKAAIQRCGSRTSRPRRPAGWTT